MERAPLIGKPIRPDKVLVGLGNPGIEYARTRHNIGFRALDAFLGWNTRKNCFTRRGKARCQVVMIDGLRVLLVKPTTFMNLSGTAVELILEFENLGIGDLLVVHDEMDLQPGKAKMRVGGNAAGHQGVASVIKAIGKDFARLKIGIGRPVKSGEDAAISWVLGTMDHEEKLRVLEAMPKVAEAMTMWLFEGPEKTMTWFNKALK